VVNHDVLGLDVPMHDSQRVTIVKSLEHLVYVVFALFGLDDLQKLLVLYGVHVLEYQTVGLALPKIYAIVYLTISNSLIVLF